MKVLFVHGEEQKPIGEHLFAMGSVMGGKTMSHTGKLGPVKGEDEETEADAENEESHGEVTITSETVKQSK